MGALVVLAVAAFARAAHHVHSSVWSPYLLLGVWSYFAVPLMLRLMDELKDADIDRELFPDRPLPSGRVLESDIKRSLAAVAAALILAGLETASISVLPSAYKDAVAIALLLIILFVRPDGLFGNAQARALQEF